MEELIAQVGYLALFLGAFLEGETVLALGGLAAQHGYLSFALVVTVAVAGGFVGDQLYFFIGRRYGERVLARFPALARRAPRVRELLRRYDALALIAVRFLYGLRIVGPILIAACGIARWRLALFNLIGALLWAPLIVGIAYLTGQALEAWAGRLKAAQIAVTMAALLAVIVVWLVAQLARRNGSPRQQNK